MNDPYRLIVESVKDYALILLDARGNVTSWNPGARAIKGYTADEVIGKHFSIFYPREERATRPAKELEIATRDGRFEEEAWRVRKDGSPFWANVVLAPVRDDHGAVVGYAKVTRDLTERELNRAALRRLSTPVISLWPGILLMPLTGEIDAARAEDIMQIALDRVVEENARVFIVDVSGVPTMDTHVADTILKTAAALRLVGAQAILTGIGPRASSAMVRLGVNVSEMITDNKLAGGLERALSIVGKTVIDVAKTR